MLLGGAPASHCFNSQPPEGGWLGAVVAVVQAERFNSQPPEGGWLCYLFGSYI